MTCGAILLAMGWLAMPHAQIQGQSNGQAADCGSCHVSSGWDKVTFDHNSTRFPLRDRHAKLVCSACHVDMKQLAVSIRCDSCHKDPHKGRAGVFCDQCHSARSFRDTIGAKAHRRTRFPLDGRHRLVPCDECHQNKTDKTFAGVPTRCQACHWNDLLKTQGGNTRTVDHVKAGFSGDCRQCHTTGQWQAGHWPEHERCFPITFGNHGGIRCLNCHTSIPASAVSSAGTSVCNTMTASCIRCHSCAKMDGEHRGEVEGYQCADRKCYECHPQGTEDD